MIEIGSLWRGSGSDEFRVIGVVEKDGHIWVHYRNEQNHTLTEVREYSCYQESFLQRFTPHNNDKR